MGALMTCKKRPRGDDGTFKAGAISKPVLISSMMPTQRQQMEQARKADSVRFQPSRVRVLSGAPMSKVDVGGVPQYTACAQNPPGRGDSWQLNFFAEPGGYEIWFHGGDNSHHGILTASVDSQSIGLVDQYAVGNSYPTEHCLYWECESAGEHTLHGIAESKAPASVNYWICLFRITFQPVPSRRTMVLQLHAVETDPGLLEVRCLNMSGDQAAVVHCSSVARVAELRNLLCETFPFTWQLGLTLETGCLLNPEDDYKSCGEILTNLSHTS